MELKPAILYRDQIREYIQDIFYTEDMFYMSGGLENWCPDISSAPHYGKYDFAIVHNDKLIGFICYQIDFYVSKAYNFGFISFDKGNPLVGKAVYEHLVELMKKVHRIEWRMVSGNPAERGYDHFIQKFGGTKHILKDAYKDEKGNYHDDIIYEIINRGDK